MTHIRKRNLYEWIMKLDERGIKEFKFGELPDDLKFQRGIQKAKDLGLLKSVETVEGCHIWRIVTSKISKKTMGIQNKKELKKVRILK